ncbi:type I 3-dehydroquinate dehydratase, partial [bacterium]|nr:type I 3-dehydroquinate dehydratase [bacterium]
MVCVSLEEAKAEECLKVLQRVPFAEIRLDRMSPTEKEVENIFSTHPQLIVTCRPGAFSEKKRRKLLRKGITAGAAYVDIELEAEKKFKEEIVREAARHHCRVIVSTHHFEGTPSPEELQILKERCFDAGAEIAKISCLVRRKEENARLLAL